MINEASDWVKFCVNDVIKLASNKIALDLACGIGRNSIYLAKKGYKVISVDINSMSLSKFYQNNVYKIQSDIENLGRWPFKNNIFDIVIVTNILNRLIFSKIESVIKQNGYLVYETFGLGHEKLGRPKNKNYLLNKGELLKLTKCMNMIYYEELKVINKEKQFIKHRILCRNVR